jgi:hypothetical protein
MKRINLNFQREDGINFQPGPLTTLKDNLKGKAPEKQQRLEKLLPVPKIYTSTNYQLLDYIFYSEVLTKDSLWR